MRPAAVVKVGGSLGKGDRLQEVCAQLARLSPAHAFLVVPGGGAFADAVRDAYQHYRLSERSAHRMALLAMDQYGYVLSELTPGSRLVQALEDIPGILAAGDLPILLPAAALIQADPLPNSWEVTSDSIAAWVAAALHCRRLVLIKSVDGVASPAGGGEIAASLAAGDLPAGCEAVDPYLREFLPHTGLETWILNGLYPERIAQLFAAGTTTGTQIRPAPVQVEAG